MRRREFSKLALQAAAIGVVSATPSPRLSAEQTTLQEPERQWGQWRGPRATGAAHPAAAPPVRWDEANNVRWKTPLPGRGHSSPVVWGDHIFLTAAVPVGEAFAPIHDNAPGSHDNLPVTHKHGFQVIAVNRHSGKILWQQEVRQAIPHEGAHRSASLASPSPMTDGRRVYASFGSQGLYCLDLKGKRLWSKQLGTMNTKHAHGEGATPVLHDDTLVVNWDHEGESFVVALAAEDGAERWRRRRDEVTSWASPIVVEHEGQRQVIISGTSRVRAYDLASGDVIWECGGLSANVVASPVASDGVVIAASSYDTRAILAIKLDGARGDITGSKQVLWSRRRSTPYVPSPLLYGDSVYYLSHYQGVLSRVEFKTGKEPLGPFRLGGIRNIYASPVAAADRVYVTDREGLTMVIAHSDEPQLLSANRLNDTFNASAAIVDDAMYLRGERYLYALAEEA